MMSAFVPGYEYDIFISYAHVDNLTALPGEAGWVELFHRHLEVQLTKRFGRANMVKIWRDQRLEGGHLFDEVIQNRIDRAAVFLLLLSPGYMASAYCQQEIRRFFDKAQAEALGLQVGERNRILNVMLDNIPHEAWPKEVGRISGYPFYDDQDEAFSEPLDPMDKVFQMPLRGLVRTLHAILSEFAELKRDSTDPSIEAPAVVTPVVEIPAVPSPSFPSPAVLRQAAPPSPPPQAAGGPGGEVYLAEVADSLRKTLKRVTSELHQQGIEVYKTVPPPYASAEHDAAVRDAMQRAQLSVHLLDGWEGREMDDEEITYPQKQVALGLQHAQHQLIWMPHQLDLDDVEDPDHQAFLSRLENDTQARDGATFELIRGGQSAPEIVREIAAKLAQFNQPAQPVVQPAVLLDTHVKDQLFALETSRVLLEKKRPTLHQS